MLDTERKKKSDLQQSFELQQSQLQSKNSENNTHIKNSDLQRSLELQQRQLHSKDSEIGILEMEHRYHVAEVKSLKEKVCNL